MRLSQLYESYCLLISTSVFLYLGILVWVSATLQGISTGSYEVSFTIQTNNIGENFIELVLVLSAVPGAIFYLLKRVRGFRQKQAQERKGIE